MTGYPDLVLAPEFTSWREATLSAHCPYCGEENGEKCRDRSGRRQQIAHSSRFRAARQAGAILEVPCQGEDCPNHGDS